jgi:hypothetical protein
MFTVASIIPTGVGAAIGGFAGDGGPATKLLGAVADVLVTHPNAVNGADLLGLPATGLYVEGWALDAWLAGRLALRPARARRVGLLVDRAVEAMPAGTLDALLNAAEAVRAVHGIAMPGWDLTPRPLGARLAWGAGGQSTGSVADPAALLEGARALLAAGCDAIALAADLGPLDPDAEAAYDAGRAVDPIGGLEAVLSHLVVAELGVPAAHAPLWPYAPATPQRVDPRAAAEHLGHTFLPCILMGLARHPGLVPAAEARAGDLADVDALVVPAGCLGGPGAIAARDRGVPILAVAGNETALAVDAEALGWAGEPGVIPVRSYLEAAGVLAAMRAGVDWRACTRPFAPLPRLGSV